MSGSAMNAARTRAKGPSRASIDAGASGLASAVPLVHALLVEYRQHAQRRLPLCGPEVTSRRDGSAPAVGVDGGRGAAPLRRRPSCASRATESRGR